MDIIAEPKARTFQEANKISGQMIDDILCSAFEGGSNYWAEKVEIIGSKPKGANYSSECVSRGGKLRLLEVGDGDVKKWHTITEPKIRRGIEAAAVLRGQTIEKFYEENDAEAADIALQFALFGKLIYG